MAVQSQPKTTQSQDDFLSARALVARSGRLSRPRYVTVIVGLIAVSAGLSALVMMTGSTTLLSASWWPATGVGALLVLVYRGPLWHSIVLVASVTAGVHLACGASAIEALMAGGAIAIGLVVFARLAGERGRSVTLITVGALLRLMLALALASLTIGVFSALASVALAGSLAPESALSVALAQFAALLMVIPLALVPLSRRSGGATTELVLQALMTTAIALAIFAPSHSLEIGAVLVPFLGWGAARFHPLVPSIELLGIGVIATALSLLGRGPFVVAGADAGAGATMTLLQVYLISLAATIQVIAVVRSERSILRAENERRAALLRQGLAASQVGTVFVKPDPTAGVSIVEMNEVAEAVVDEAWFSELIEAWLGEESASLSTEVTLDDGRSVQVHGQRVLTDDGDSVLAIQLIDVTAFVRAREAMAQAVEHEREMIDKLHALARQKEDFVAAVSHELRTPLTSIVGFAEDLHGSLKEEQREATTIILRNADRLTEMVEDLLELGRMTTPNPIRESGSFDLSVIAANTVRDQSKTATGRQVTVQVNDSSEPAMVVSSANALSRIATNLVSNAIKFTPVGGVVRVSTQVADDLVHFTVEDSGPGISAVDEPHVFERFFRSADPARRRTPGTGLGLSIVKSLVELLHGEVSVGRSDLGGARMAVSLPRDRGEHGTV